MRISTATAPNVAYSVSTPSCVSVRARANTALTVIVARSAVTTVSRARVSGIALSAGGARYRCTVMRSSNRKKEAAVMSSASTHAACSGGRAFLMYTLPSQMMRAVRGNDSAV